MKLIEKLFGKKKKSIEVVSDYWQTGVKSIKIPVEKRYGSSKEEYIEISIVKRDDKEKALVQFNDVIEWGSIAPSRNTELHVEMTAEEIEAIALKLLEAAQMVEAYSEEEK